MKKKLTLIMSLVLAVLLCFVAGCNMLDGTAPEFQYDSNGAYVSVTDGQLPAITDLQVRSADYNTNEKAIAKFKEGVKAVDNVDGEIDFVVTLGSFDYQAVGTYTITYTATDAAGNVTVVTRSVKTVDSTAPRFSNEATDGKLPKITHLQFTEYNKGNFIDDQTTVIDNVDTNIVPTVEMKNYNKDVAGTYTIEYTATDSSGLVTKIERDVEVQEAIKYVVDALVYGDQSVAASYNDTNALDVDTNGSLNFRNVDQVALFKEDVYFSTVATNSAAGKYSNNGGVPFLPYGSLAAFDEDFNLVLVRVASAGLEAIKDASGNWTITKNGSIVVDGEEKQISTNFIVGSDPAATGVSVLGGNLRNYVPTGGYVALAGSPTSDAACRQFINRFLSETYVSGSLMWDDAWITTIPDSLKNATSENISYEEDYTTIWKKPAQIATPVVTVEKHEFKWEAAEGAKEYEIYVDGELVKTITTTSIKALDLELDPSTTEDPNYDIQVKAISSDVRFYGTSEISTALVYVMPNAQKLAKPVTQINETTGQISWEAVDNATGYQIYAVQNTANPIIELATVGSDVLSYNLKDNSTLNSLAYTARIHVKAIGDDVESLDSDASDSKLWMCSPERVISFGDENTYPVIVTTVADYFGGGNNARRNSSTDIGYSGKDFLFLITDPKNLVADTAVHNEGGGAFIIVFDSEGKVKSIVNIVNTTKQLVNGVWMTAIKSGTPEEGQVLYTANSYQLLPAVLSTIVEGDTMLIGKNAGSHPLANGVTGWNMRDVLASYFWSNTYSTETTTTTQPWRSEATITSNYPTYAVKYANPSMLDQPELAIDGTVVSWDAIEGATGYHLWIDGNAKDDLTTNSFDLKDYFASIGRSGGAATASNKSTFAIKVVAFGGEEAEESIAAEDSFEVATTLKVGENSMNITYNLENSFYNPGSGANLRSNDVVSTLMTGSVYKSARTAYTGPGKYASTANDLWMANGIIVVLGSDMKVKKIRYGYGADAPIEIQADGSFVTTGLTWNNAGANATTVTGNFMNLHNELEDTDVVLVVANRDSKVQLSAVIQYFINPENTTAAQNIATLTQSAVDYTTLNCSVEFTGTKVAK